jgi:beta-lactamase superfamily II metal-dependent hydrolase
MVEGREKHQNLKDYGLKYERPATRTIIEYLDSKGVKVVD